MRPHHDLNYARCFYFARDLKYMCFINHKRRLKLWLLLLIEDILLKEIMFLV